MNKSLLNKRMPTLLGLFLILIGIGLTSTLIKNNATNTSHASPTETPQSVRITNISDTSFTVSYTTSTNLLGSISYGKDQTLGSVATDDQDQKTSITPRSLHYFTIKNLEQNTHYFFTILSGQSTFLDNNKPYQLTTGPILTDDASSYTPITGSIVTEAGEVPQDAIIYVKTDSSQVLSSLVKPDGSYVVSTNTIRSSDLLTLAPVSNSTTFSLLIMTPSVSSNITVIAKQANPVPTITVGKDYDFSQNTSFDNAVVASSSVSVRFPSFSATEVKSNAPQILNPQNNASLPDQKPQFRGTALPKSSVQIIIHSSDQMQTTVVSDANGNWVYRPTSDLTPGEHTITIIARTASGVLKTITQSFTVYAAGNQVQDSATPSATPTVFVPTNTPTPTVIINTPTPTVFTTIQPTSLPSPTQIILPTATPIPTLVLAPSIISPTPPSKIGSPGSEDAIIAAVSASAAIIIGVGLILFTKQKISI